MEPGFSEFSYGFALTHEIVNRWQGSGVTAAPVFPSQYQEGQAGGGYDIRWDLPGVPLILQFKISERMVRRSAGEWGWFQSPYYRFWMHARRRSDQHDLLVQLDDGTAEVYYAAPTIHEVADLNRAFLLGRVQENSIFFRPNDIGVLPDDDAHCMAFLPSSSVGYRFSQPKEVRVSGRGESFTRELQTRLAEHRLKSGSGYFERVASLLEQRGAMRGDIAPERVISRQREWPLPVRAGYLARTILGAELLWVIDETRLGEADRRRLREGAG